MLGVAPGGLRCLHRLRGGGLALVDVGEGRLDRLDLALQVELARDAGPRQVLAPVRQRQGQLVGKRGEFSVELAAAGREPVGLRLDPAEVEPGLVNHRIDLAQGLLGDRQGIAVLDRVEGGAGQAADDPADAGQDGLGHAGLLLRADSSGAATETPTWMVSASPSSVRRALARSCQGPS